VADTLESQYNIVVNKNSVPNDTRSFIDTSGIRIGTAAMVTKKGNDKEYFKDIALKIIGVINK
jgi:glycine hydroxymethyltransferase